MKNSELELQQGLKLQIEIVWGGGGWIDSLYFGSSLKEVWEEIVFPQNFTYILSPLHLLQPLKPTWELLKYISLQLSSIDLIRAWLLTTGYQTLVKVSFERKGFVSLMDSWMSIICFAVNTIIYWTFNTFFCGSASMFPEVSWEWACRRYKWQ